MRLFLTERRERRLGSIAEVNSRFCCTLQLQGDVERWFTITKLTQPNLRLMLLCR